MYKNKKQSQHIKNINQKSDFVLLTFIRTKLVQKTRNQTGREYTTAGRLFNTGTTTQNAKNSLLKK